MKFLCMLWMPLVGVNTRLLAQIIFLYTVGAKIKFSYSTILLPYLTVVLPYFNNACTLLTAYFRRILIVLLLYPLRYSNRTAAVFSLYHTQPLKIGGRVRDFLRG